MAGVLMACYLYLLALEADLQGWRLWAWRGFLCLALALWSELWFYLSCAWDLPLGLGWLG